MNKNLSQQILDFLNSSLVPSFLKGMITIALPSYSEQKKIRVLEILINEAKQYKVLDRKQERLIAKYANTLQRIRDKKHLK